jgi:hypothetical protein
MENTSQQSFEGEEEGAHHANEEDRAIPLKELIPSLSQGKIIGNV